MKNGMRAYFWDHFRANLKTLLFITLFSLVMTFVYASESQIIEYTHYIDFPHEEVNMVIYSATLDVPVFILIVCSYLAPVIEFRLFKKRRNLDCFYALPIERKNIALAHYLMGLITVVVPFTLSYVLNALFFLRAPSAYRFLPLLPHYFITLVIGISQYSLFAFVFNRANTTLDGIWFIILWTFVFGLVAEAINQVTSYYLDSSVFVIFLLHSALTNLYGDKITGVTDYLELLLSDRMWEPELIASLVLNVICGILAAIGSITAFGRGRTEKTEEISDSWFGFKLLIPVCAVSGMIISLASADVMSWTGIEVYAFVGYTIYRRGFHYKKSDIIILALLALFVVGTF